MNTLYSPRAMSLACKVCDYFKRDPDAVLSIADIKLKFDVPSTSVDACLTDAVNARLLRRTSGLYRAGTNLGKWDQASTTAQDQAGIATTMSIASPFVTAPKRRRPPPIDMASIAIENQPPPPPPNKKRGGNDWAALLSRMKPGQATAPVDAIYKSAAKSAMLKFKKAHGGDFTVGHCSPTHIRIWRTA